MRICIVLPVHNRKLYTCNILTQIYAQLEKDKELDITTVIVVDDGSTDGTKELIQNKFPLVHLLIGDGSLWWTGAIVKGMKYAIYTLNADYLVWLNDDLSIVNDFMRNLIDIFRSSQYEETIVGGVVRDKTYSNWIVYSGIKDEQRIDNLNYFSESEEVDVSILHGNIVVIPRKIINKIGFPDDAKFTQNGGDFEYTERAKKSGFRVILFLKIQATADFTVMDIIRYMPHWMQWYLQPSISKRREIIKGLTDLKTHYNVWHFVNMQHLDSTHIPVWRYTLCYFRRLIRLLITDLLPKKYVESKIYEYLRHDTPSELVQAVIAQRKTR